MKVVRCTCGQLVWYGDWPELFDENGDYHCPTCRQVAAKPEGDGDD